MPDNAKEQLVKIKTRCEQNQQMYKHEVQWLISEVERMSKQQFILYYPPGRTVLPNDETKSNTELAKEILEELAAGVNLGFPKLEGWRIAQRKSNGEFEEIFPEPLEKRYHVLCTNCEAIRYFTKKDITFGKNGVNAVYCNGCGMQILVREEIV